MPSRDYLLNYKGQNSDLIQKSGVVLRMLKALDAAADRLLKKLVGLFQPSSKAAANAAASYAKAAANLQATAAAAQAAAAQLQAVAAGGTAATTATQVTIRTTNSLRSAFGRLGAGMLALRAGHAILSTVQDALEKANEFANETAKGVLKLNDALRELTAITGKTSAKEASDEVIGLMVASGAKAEEATAFDVMWESAVSAAEKSGNWMAGLTPEKRKEETAKAKQMALRFAVMNDIAPDVVGRMVPAIGTFQKVNNAEDVMSEMGIIHRMGVEGVDKFKPMMVDMNRLMSTMVKPKGGMAANASEAMAIISAATGPAGGAAPARRMIDQMTREFSIVDSDTKKATFEKADIVPGKDDFLSTMQKLKPLIDAKVAAGVAPMQAYIDLGFKKPAANMNIDKFMASLPVLEKSMETVRKGGDPAKLKADLDRYREMDEGGRFGEALKFKAEHERGLERSDLAKYRLRAEAGLIKDKRIETWSADIAEGLETAGTLGSYTGRESSMDSIIIDKLRTIVPRIKNAASLSREGLSEAIRTLSPEESKAFSDAMFEYGTFGAKGDPGKPRTGAKVPATRPGVTYGGGIGGSGFGGSPGAGGWGGAAADGPTTVALLDRLNHKTDTTNALLASRGGSGGRPVVPMRGIAPDALSGGALRT